ncbi:hypothetical protein N9Y74_01390 [Alphaproteobacteria bacterium]|nr:hypothetical protein [Alphaproteobacteria bacterium]
MRSKIDEITGVEVSTLNQSRKTKVSFENYYSDGKTSLHHNLEQDLYVKRNLDYFKDFNTRCREASNAGKDYNCSFYYITLRVRNRIISETNYYSRLSLVKAISEKFIRRVNAELGVKNQDSVGNKNRHFVAHASTFIEARTKYGNKDFHHAHIVLALYHSKAKILNTRKTELIEAALQCSAGDLDFSENTLSELLQSVKVQRINVASREKRYNELKRVLHYSSKHCHRDEDEFANFTNMKMVIRENNKNDRLDRLLGNTNRRVQGTRTIGTSGIRI